MPISITGDKFRFELLNCNLHSNDLLVGPPVTCDCSFILDATILGLSKKLLSFNVIKSLVDLIVNVVSKEVDSGELVPVLLTLDNNVQSLYVRDGIRVCNTS